MAFQLLVSIQETAIILNWFETALQKSTRFGPNHYIFPEEEILVNRLKSNNEEMYLDELDLQIINGWMEKSVMPFPGTLEVYFPGEELLVKKLNQAKKNSSAL